MNSTLEKILRPIVARSIREWPDCKCGKPIPIYGFDENYSEVLLRCRSHEAARLRVSLSDSELERIRVAMGKHTAECDKPMPPDSAPMCISCGIAGKPEFTVNQTYANGLCDSCYKHNIGQKPTGLELKPEHKVKRCCPVIAKKCDNCDYTCGLLTSDNLCSNCAKDGAAMFTVHAEDCKGYPAFPEKSVQGDNCKYCKRTIPKGMEACGACSVVYKPKITDPIYCECGKQLKLMEPRVGVRAKQWGLTCFGHFDEDQPTRVL